MTRLFVVASIAAVYAALAPPGLAAQYVLYDLDPPGGAASSKTCISNSGEVVAYKPEADGRLQTFFWNPVARTTRAMGHDVLSTGRIVAIRGTDELAGWMGWYDGQFYYDHATVWSPETGTLDLGTLGGPNSEAGGINNNGLAFGVSDVDDHGTKGIFLWDAANGMRSIFTWSSHDMYDPRAINHSGWIAGFVYRPAAGYTAFVWDPVGGFNFLGLGLAYDINNAGRITGVLWEGRLQGPVLWNPIPEPSALALLAFGAAAIGLRWSRQRRL